MAGAAHDDYHHGEMDVAEQRSMFDGFINVTVWGSALVVMYVAMFTLAFAIGAGWLAGLAALAAIGVATGLLFKMNSTWWALLVIQVVLLGVGGAVVPWMMSLAG